MTKYNTILFDLDDTLIDNSFSIQGAFCEVLQFLKIPYCQELLTSWKSFDQAYWSSVESGNFCAPEQYTLPIEKSQYFRSKRFQLFFSSYHFDDAFAIQLNDLYVRNLSKQVKVIDGAQEVLEYLCSRYMLFIITNGPRRAAICKVNSASFQSYISQIISSGEIGYSKPDYRFFDYFYSHYPFIQKEKTLIVGDCLTTDVLGGVQYGIDTCWYNPTQNGNPYSYTPTMEITRLRELTKIL